MPPTAVHGMIGYVLGKTQSKKNKDHAPDLIFGSIIGSVAPDLDLLLLSMPIALYTFVTGKIDWELAASAHRTITHSFITISVIFLLGIFLKKKKRHQLQVTFTSRNGKMLKINVPTLLLGIVLGMSFHSIADLFYVSDVALFWPIIPTRLSIFNIDFFELDPFIQRMFAIFDSLPEPLWWLGFVWWSHRIHQNFNRKDKYWILLASGYLLLFFISVAIAFVLPDHHTETFLSILLIPGIWMYLLTTVVVWQYKEIFYISREKTTS